jgi:hypothetical protein
MEPRYDEKNLSENELREMVGEIREILWPDGNKHHEWNADTLSNIAMVLQLRGVEP